MLKAPVSDRPLLFLHELATRAHSPARKWPVQLLLRPLFRIPEVVAYESFDCIRIPDSDALLTVKKTSDLCLHSNS